MLDWWLLQPRPWTLGHAFGIYSTGQSAKRSWCCYLLASHPQTLWYQTWDGNLSAKSCHSWISHCRHLTRLIDWYPVFICKYRGRHWVTNPVTSLDTIILQAEIWTNTFRICVLIGLSWCLSAALSSSAAAYMCGGIVYTYKLVLCIHVRTMWLWLSVWMNARSKVLLEGDWRMLKAGIWLNSQASKCGVRCSG